MKYSEFKKIIRNKFEGHKIKFECNGIEFAAHVDQDFMFVSNPFSECIQGFMKGRSIGLMNY